MSTKFNHVQIGVVDNNGDVNVLYPQNTASDVSIDRSKNKKIYSNINKLQDLVDNMHEMSFVNKDEISFIGKSMEPEINDNEISSSSTWSSEKINNTKYTHLIDQSEVKNNINKLFTNPKSYIVNISSGIELPSYVSTSGFWLVEYFPIDISFMTGIVSYAYQRWTSMDDQHKQYFRVYQLNSWQRFIIK